MKMKVRQATPCRAYDIEMDNELFAVHQALMGRLRESGAVVPRGGADFPMLRKTERVGTRAVFFLDERFCERYEAEMALELNSPFPVPAS